LPRTGFSVSKVKSGPTKVLLSLKDLLITMNVTHINAWRKFVQILYDYKNHFFLRAYRLRLKNQQKPSPIIGILMKFTISVHEIISLFLLNTLV
jgi:hypothetical protein